MSIRLSVLEASMVLYADLDLAKKTLAASPPVNVRCLCVDSTNLVLQHTASHQRSCVISIECHDSILRRNVHTVSWLLHPMHSTPILRHTRPLKWEIIMHIYPCCCRRTEETNSFYDRGKKHRTPCLECNIDPADDCRCAEQLTFNLFLVLNGPINATDFQDSVNGTPSIIVKNIQANGEL